MLREGGSTTSVVTGSRRRVNTTWEDGAELVEEYDMASGELLVRKRRKKTPLGGEGEWEFLVGEPPTRWNPDGSTLRESSLNPIFGRKDTPDCFQWRVRNLPYPPDTYSVTIDHGERKIVVRTSNKKYFKRFGVPELDALRLPLSDAALSWAHAHATLVISYAKPAAVLQAEAREAQAIVEAQGRPAREGDVDCKQQ